MASSPKKANRPAVKVEQTAVTAAAPLDFDISASALQAAEVLPPVAEPAAELPAEVLEAAPVEVLDAAVAEVVEAPFALATEPPVAEVVEAPAPLLEAPAAVEAVAPPAPSGPPTAIKAFDVRALVEKQLVESRAKFAQVKTAAEEASAAVEASYDAARDGVVAFNVKAIETMKAGVDANFDLVVSLALAKSVSELVQLQSEFARKQLEETTSQAKALGELARRIADETIAPIKAHVAKTFKVAV